MRPKKIILIVDADPEQLSIRSFLLRTRGYRVIAVASAPAAIAIFTGGQAEIVLAELALSGMDGNALIGCLKEISPSTPMILTSDSVRAGERAHRADRFLSKGHTSADLVECIRIMSQRKRGPKPIPPYMQAANDDAPSLAPSQATAA
jgi:two-component system response regulator CpxR